MQLFFIFLKRKEGKLKYLSNNAANISEWQCTIFQWFLKSRCTNEYICPFFFYIWINLMKFCNSFVSRTQNKRNVIFITIRWQTFLKKNSNISNTDKNRPKDSQFTFLDIYLSLHRYAHKICHFSCSWKIS